MSPGAIFDLDGTLIAGTSAERLFVPFLARRGALGPRQWIPFLSELLPLPLVGRTRAMRRNKRYLTGLEIGEVERLTRDFLITTLRARYHEGTIARLRRLREEGKVVCLLTGAPDFLADAVAEDLGIAVASGTRLDTRDGRYTGRLAGPHWFGPAKVEGVRELAREHDLDLDRSFGFADHVQDIPFLGCFGHPVAVDPHPGLREHAEAHGWEIL